MQGADVPAVCQSETSTGEIEMTELQEKQKVARLALLDLLINVGVKSADLTREMEAMEYALMCSQAHFGAPDELLMSPQTLSAFRKAFSGSLSSGKVKP